jgi:transketolase
VEAAGLEDLSYRVDLVKAVDPDYEIVGKLSVSLDDIKTFRQLGSRCPGQPNRR